VPEVDIPFYAGLKVGVPSLPALVETLADGRYDVVHCARPGPAGVPRRSIAAVMGLPVLGSYHTELAAYAGLRTLDPMLELYARMALAAFYGAATTSCRRRPRATRCCADGPAGGEGRPLGPRRGSRPLDPAKREVGLLGGGPERVNVLVRGPG
jgi:hypothetical protein